jgi:hypothetical protein
MRRTTASILCSKDMFLDAEIQILSPHTFTLFTGEKNNFYNKLLNVV